MISSVCLNPSIDRTIGIAEFTYGGMNRVINARDDAGGKGINVAVTAAQLGAEAECLGFLCRENSSTIEKRLSENGVSSDFVWLDGRVRINIKLLDQSKQVITEINEPGVPVKPYDLDQLIDLLCDHARRSDFLVLSGSMPPGCPVDIYRTLIEKAHQLQLKCVLDADGAAFREGVYAHPYLIKPNLHELEMAVGEKLTSLDEVCRAASGFIERGVAVVAVSMGGDGALITDGTSTYYAPRMEVTVQSTVGAGDAMVAGLVYGMIRKLPLDELFVCGIASATASVMSEGTQLVDQKLYRELVDRVTVKKIK